ncbi:hypothetical protein JTB14_016697 [Gonioctena quinquepunctata]|nr:hypothetical protein JTB14_016697 [Gonioctena quinquepunctata]
MLSPRPRPVRSDLENSVPVRRAKRSTENELEATTRTLSDEESVEEVGGESGTLEDEAREKSGHNTESEKEPNDTDEEQADADQELNNSDVDEEIRRVRPVKSILWLEVRK